MLKKLAAITIIAVMVLAIIPVGTLAAAPMADNVSITGETTAAVRTIGEALTANYEYSGSSVLPAYQWYVALTEGSGYKKIAGAIGQAFKPDAIYANKYIKVSVTLETQGGDFGSEVFSEGVKIFSSDIVIIDEDFSSAGWFWKGNNAGEGTMEAMNGVFHSQFTECSTTSATVYREVAAQSPVTSCVIFETYAKLGTNARNLLFRVYDSSAAEKQSVNIQQDVTTGGITIKPAGAGATQGYFTNDGQFHLYTFKADVANAVFSVAIDGIVVATGALSDTANINKVWICTTYGEYWFDYVDCYSPAPVVTFAQNPVISGDNRSAGSLLTAAFDYYNINSEAAGTHTYQWYAAPEAEGTYTAIAGETASAYTISKFLMGQYVKCKITPYSSVSGVGFPAETASVKVDGARVMVNRNDFTSAEDLDEFDPQVTGLTKTILDNEVGFFDSRGVVGVTRAAVTSTGGAYRPLFDGEVIVLEAKAKYISDPNANGIRINLRSPSGYLYSVALASQANGSGNALDNGQVVTYKLNQATGADSTIIGGAAATNIIKAGTFTVMKLIADVSANKLYVYADDTLCHTIDCSSQYTLGSGLYFNVTTRGSATCIDYIDCYALVPGGDTVAKNVKLLGYSSAGRELRTTFDYYDAKGTAEGTHAYQWYSAPSKNGAYSPISGAVSQKYMVPYELIGKYVKCTITPYSTAGAGLPSETKSVLITGTAASFCNANFESSSDIDLFTTKATGLNATVSNGVAFFDASAVAGIVRATSVAKTGSIKPETAGDAMSMEIRGKFDANAANAANGFKIHLHATGTATPDYSIGYLTQSASTTQGLLLGYTRKDNKNTVNIGLGVKVGVFSTLKVVADRVANTVGIYFDGELKATLSGATYTPLTSGMYFSVEILGINTSLDYIHADSLSSGGGFIDVESAKITANDTELSKIAAGNEIKGKISVRNYSDSVKPVTVLVATYQDNMLKDVKMEILQIPVSTVWQTVSTNESITVSSDSTKACIFVWDSADSMKPYLAPTRIFK